MVTESRVKRCTRRKCQQTEKNNCKLSCIIVCDADNDCIGACVKTKCQKKKRQWERKC